MGRAKWVVIRGAGGADGACFEGISEIWMLCLGRQDGGCVETAAVVVMPGRRDF